MTTYLFPFQRLHYCHLKFAQAVVLFICLIPFTEIGVKSEDQSVMASILRYLWCKLMGIPIFEEPPKYQFPDTLEDFGYKFNDKGQLVSITDGKSRFNFQVRPDDMNYNQQHYEALGDQVTEFLYKKMETELKLQRVYLPVDGKKEEPQSFIFVSPEALKQNKLMVLIHGSGMVRAGQWSRKLIINEDVDTGSQLPYIRRAIQDGYGVIVLNTNLNEQVVNGKPRFIRGNMNPKEHGVYVWRNLVLKAQASNIVIVAHSFGGIVTCHMAEKFLADFKKRVFAVVFTDSVHTTERRLWSMPVKSFMKERAVNFASAYVPINYIMESSDPEDVMSVSAGTKEHERTSHAAFDSAFKFIGDNYESWTRDGTAAQRHFLPLPDDLSQYAPGKDWDQKASKKKPSARPAAPVNAKSENGELEEPCQDPASKYKVDVPMALTATADTDAANKGKEGQGENNGKEASECDAESLAGKDQTQGKGGEDGKTSQKAQDQEGDCDEKDESASPGAAGDSSQKDAALP